jgi:hypothetical protein
VFTRNAISAFFVTAALLALLAPGTRAQAGSYACRCHPSGEVFSSPFFGYYPTCWRAWPPGQPPCPPAIFPLPAVEKDGSAPKGASPKEELLPRPIQEKKLPSGKQ